MGVLAAVEQLRELAPKASQMRQRHLHESLDRARARKDKTTDERIIQILWREYNAKRYGRLRCAFGKSKGNLASRIVVPTGESNDTGAPILGTEKEVVRTSIEHLSERFSTADKSPFSSGQLLDDVGYAGDGKSVKKILEGTYDFPADCTKATK